MSWIQLTEEIILVAELKSTIDVLVNTANNNLNWFCAVATTGQWDPDSCCIHSQTRDSCVGYSPTFVCPTIKRPTIISPFKLKRERAQPGIDIFSAACWEKCSTTNFKNTRIEEAQKLRCGVASKYSTRVWRDGQRQSFWAVRRAGILFILYIDISKFSATYKRPQHEFFHLSSDTKALCQLLSPIFRPNPKLTIITSLQQVSHLA